jgi:hypothetical protein
MLLYNVRLCSCGCSVIDYLAWNARILAGSDLFVPQFITNLITNVEASDHEKDSSDQKQKTEDKRRGPR